MKKGNKNLFIIFGTTSGIGKALYEYASNFAGNNFILANRKSLKITKEDVCQKLTLDLSKSFTKDKIFKLRELFSQQDGYKNMYLVLNPEKRENFYIGYNKELFGIIGISISSYQALQLNKHLKKAVWARYSDTLTALKNLKTREIPMGLIANWTKTLDKILEDVKLTPYFDFVYSSHNLKIEKPNPKIFTKTLKNVIKKFDKVYYVGNDYELDIAPARDAGLMPILIDRNNRYPDSVDCVRIKKLTDLEKIIK